MDSVTATSPKVLSRSLTRSRFWRAAEENENADMSISRYSRRQYVKL